MKIRSEVYPANTRKVGGVAIGAVVRLYYNDGRVDTSYYLVTDHKGPLENITPAALGGYEICPLLVNLGTGELSEVHGSTRCVVQTQAELAPEGCGG
jgi:hypothetical protein